MLCANASISPDVSSGLECSAIKLKHYYFMYSLLGNSVFIEQYSEFSKEEKYWISCQMSLSCDGVRHSSFIPAPPPPPILTSVFQGGGVARWSLMQLKRTSNLYSYSYCTTIVIFDILH